MRNILVVLLITLLPVPALYSQTEQSPQSKIIPLDFRNVRWHMTPEQVKASEKDAQPEEESADTLVYKDVLFDTQVKVEYFFNKGRLVCCNMKFEYDGADQDRTLKLTRNLIDLMMEKYGVSVKINVERSVSGITENNTTWNTKRSEIKQVITYGSSLASIAILYSSKLPQNSNRNSPDYYKY
jgi:hypothetical protein